jgi:hypothetical protein
MADSPPVFPTPKSPNPWLGPILTIIAIVVAILWAYLQMRHWKEPEADYMSISANMLVSLLLWGVLIWAVCRNVKDAGRAKSLTAQIQTIKDEHATQIRHLHSQGATSKRLEIVNVWDRDTVTFRQDVVGTVSDPKLPIELRVFAGGIWYRQWPVKIEDHKWRGKCQFGNEEGLGRPGDYKVVAMSPMSSLPDKIADLPKDGITSAIITVHKPAQTQKSSRWRLNIHSAKWICKKDGVVVKTVSVEDAIRKHIEDVIVESIEIKLVNDNLAGCGKSNWAA